MCIRDRWRASLRHWAMTVGSSGYVTPKPVTVRRGMWAGGRAPWQISPSRSVAMSVRTIQMAPLILPCG
eukprot:12916618-Alexandrium_andersonii.AAC.1